MIWVLLGIGALVAAYWLGWCDRGLEEEHKYYLRRLDRIINRCRKERGAEPEQERSAE